MTVDEIVKLAGGVSKLAALLGVDHSSVSWWKRQGHIPPERAIAIHEILDVPLREIPRRRQKAA